MKWFTSAVLIVLVITAPAFADAITWGPATLSDDNGGNFLTSASVTKAGALWELMLPLYLSTGNFTFPPDGSPSQINLSVSASIASGSIVGVTYTFFGSFAGAGLATFSQAADAAPTARGSFSSSSFSDFSAVSPASALNLSTTLNIFDQGDSAAISEVRFQLATVPEPGTITLLASGLGLLAALRLRRRASQSKGRIL